MTGVQTCALPIFAVNHDVSKIPIGDVEISPKDQDNVSNLSMASQPKKRDLKAAKKSVVLQSTTRQLIFEDEADGSEDELMVASSKVSSLHQQNIGGLKRTALKQTNQNQPDMMFGFGNKQGKRL